MSDAGRGLADEAIEAFVRLARADFSVRLPRTYKKDQADIVAMFVNVIAEELDRLWTERERQRRELQDGVEQLTESFRALAAGRFDLRVPRSGKGDPLDVLGSLLEMTAGDVGGAFSEIERQRAVLQAILDSMVDGVLSLDVEGRVSLANRAAAELLGWEHPSQMVGAQFADLVGPRDREFAAGLAQSVGQEVLRDREVIFARKTGEPLGMSINASSVRSPDGALEGVVVVARDERQLKNAQAQLQLSDRLATMGTLAAGVAHEINNPLSFVTSNIDFISDVLERSEGRALGTEDYAEVMRALRASQSGAERVRLIVRDLRAFTRTEHETITRLDVRKVLDSASSMIRNEIRHHAALTKEYGEVPPVDANEARLVQVLLNLVQNAVQAIPPGSATSNQIRLVTRTSDVGEAIVEVHDTGHGIAPDDLPHIFQAFFTTKPVGVGTGLGLAICQKIVMAFGGRMDVETEVGRGSIFRVTLPPSKAIKSDPALRKKSPPPSPRSPARRRVLVVDDEVEVGDALVRLLGAAHDVVAVTGGELALQQLRIQSFDLILCDLMMPDMTGMELYRRLIREMPEVTGRVVFMTGGAFGSGVEEFLASVSNERIDKPIDRERVLGIIERS